MQLAVGCPGGIKEGRTKKELTVLWGFTVYIHMNQLVNKMYYIYYILCVYLDVCKHI